MSDPSFIVPPCLEELVLLHQDDDMVIINKPSGLLSVPGRHPQNQDCAINRLLVQYPTARIVHRLDLSTSGIMVVALHSESQRILNQQFANRIVEKTYIARVHGQTQPHGEVTLPIICDWPNRPKQKIDHEHGKPALTYYQLLHYDAVSNTSRIELKPYTGRSHQLRIHMATIGHPILGCEFYAPEDIRQLAPRLLLHASAVRLIQPGSEQTLQIDCPPDF